MASGFNAADIAALRAQVGAVRSLAADPRPLLKAWGAQTLRWIDQTFDAGGRPAWAPLKPSTLAARREGGGAGGGRILESRGHMRRSFDIAELTPDRVVIQSSDPNAVFHQYGTKGPYEIRAKNAKALAIPGGPFSLSDVKPAPGGATGFVVGRKAIRGRQPGQRIAPFKNVTFRQKVMHPGLPPRPMLPEPEQIAPELERVGQKVLAALTQRGGGGLVG